MRKTISANNGFSMPMPPAYDERRHQNGGGQHYRPPPYPQQQQSQRMSGNTHHHHPLSGSTPALHNGGGGGHGLLINSSNQNGGNGGISQHHPQQYHHKRGFGGSGSVHSQPAATIIPNNIGRDEPPASYYTHHHHPLSGSTPALHNGGGGGHGLLINSSNQNGGNGGISQHHPQQYHHKRGFGGSGSVHSQPAATIIPNNIGRDEPPASYYYSSTLNTPKSKPAKQVEQFHTKTTTLRSNKEPPSSATMDYKAGPGGFARRHTASSAHEFHQGGGGPPPPIPMQGQHIPAFSVEHLASFAVGPQFGLANPSDGVRKLKQMERNSAICPVPMLFTLHPDRVAVLDENGTLVEEFPLALITDPTAHISSDPVDFFNNVLLFVVKEHDVPSSSSGVVPTEMHIFQCLGISAQEVAEDLHHYTRGHFHKVRPGRRGGGGGRAPAAMTAHLPAHHQQQQQHPQHPSAHVAAPFRGGPPQQQQRGGGDEGGDVSGAESDHSGGAEHFELDVNTLNRCFDDIERFVQRIQSTALAQRELEMQQRNRKRGSKKDLRSAQAAAQNGILQLRAQIPSYGEFMEIFQKFKLCFNLLAKLKNHIHEPSAPELLHFLFTPLMVILDACQWGLGQQVAQHVYSPLLSLDACELLRTYLYPKEVDVWMALGKAWNTAPEDWPGALPPPYRPVFMDGFAPYGYPPASQPGGRGGPAPSRWSDGHSNNGPPPARTAEFHQPHPARYNSAPAPIHRGISAPPVQTSMRQQPPDYHHSGGPYGQGPNAHSVSTANLSSKMDNLELERINLEKERLEFERRKVLDKERELLEQERRLRDEAERLEAERRNLHRESEKRSIAESDRPDFYRGASSMHASPHLDRRTGSVQVLSNGNGHHHHHPPPTTFTPNNATYAPVSSPRGAKNDASSAHILEQSSPRQKAFLEELARRGCKIVQVTYDRNACNGKELTVNRGEYLEVLNDTRNWWECRNVHSRSGFVPHTILSVLSLEDWSGGDPNGALDEPERPPMLKKTQRISGTSDKEMASADKERANEKLTKVPLEVRMEQRYVPELLESMRKRNLLLPRRAQSTILGSAFSLSPNSTPQQVQIWLTQKRFSESTRQALSLCSASDLFQMSKGELELLCAGPDESNRLHSLLLVAKRRCNYDEGTAETRLTTLLSLRRKALEEGNQNEPESPEKATLHESLTLPSTTTTGVVRRNESYRRAHSDPKEPPPPFHVPANVRYRKEGENEVYSVRSYH